MDIPSLLKSKRKAFIDTNGFPFVYEKTLSSKLVSHRILGVDKKGEASLLWLHEVNFPITISRPPPRGYWWARMLHKNGVPWLIYDYVSSPIKDTYRRI